MATRLSRMVGSWAAATSIHSVTRVSSICAALGRGVLRPTAYGLPVLMSAAFMSQSVVAAESTTPRRQIEEITVTAERKESTVSDTSISITAFTGDFLENMGIRNQEDLQNFIPAAVIEPYDMAIRGVGRNFRSLGGDPGIATYLNGVYSEDFGIASTEGGLFDVDRIEVLRGPQGTLYGRNAIGGAVNFINNLPTDEFEGEARAIAGSHSLFENYEMLSGPIIKGILDARLTGTKRTRDGYYDDLSGHADPGNYGDENYALGLRWTPNEAIEMNTRGNERSYRRRMAGADAAGIVNISENGGQRDTTTYAYGYRAVDPAVHCASAFSRTPTVASTGVIGGVGCIIDGNPTYNFTNPVTGLNVVSQHVVAGVDKATVGTTDHPNYAYGADPALQTMLGRAGIDGTDLETDTNGLQDEYFDQQANSTDITWQIKDNLSAKYIFGYTDYFYDRTTDVDLTSSQILDDQFYVSQETEYASHELQFFFDPTEKLTTTSGLFYYTARISQRGDFYDSTGSGSRYANNFPYAPFGLGGFQAAFPKVDMFTARHAGTATDNGAAVPYYCAAGGGVIFDMYCFGSWAGDTGDNVVHGPDTVGTNLEYQTRTERYAYAVYTQGVYTFDPHFALTLGARWARDQLKGEENLFYYNESDIIPLGFGAGGNGCAPPANPGDPIVPCTSSLADVNQLLGFQGGPLCGLIGPNPDCAGAATGTILNPKRMLVGGFPMSASLWRELDRKDDDVTWRINMDWTPTDRDLIYLSATSGFRAGGFNLVFFSFNKKYKPEHLIAYELGYKGQLLDGTLQLNTAVYFYDYKNVHTFANGPGGIGASSYSTSVFAVPKAEMIGWDADFVWLATDHLTLGANGSYTHSEYTEDFSVIDPNDPERPESLFSATATLIDINGNQMLRVPESKLGSYAQYNFPLDRWGSFEVLATWSWISKVYFSVFEEDHQSAPAYSRTDVRATWTSADAAWVVAAFCNNVFDEIGLRQVDHYGATEDDNYRRSGATTDPRLYGLEVRFMFGAFK